MRTLDDLDPAGKRVFVRVDSNAPRRSMNARSFLSVWVDLLREKHRGGLENLVPAAQLVVLLAEPPDLLALVPG